MAGAAGTAAAAAASAAARERAAGVGATVVLRGVFAAGVLDGGRLGRGFGFAAAGLAATADFTAFPCDGVLRAAVLVVVLVGIWFV